MSKIKSLIFDDNMNFLSGNDETFDCDDYDMHEEPSDSIGCLLVDDGIEQF